MDKPGNPLKPALDFSSLSSDDAVCLINALLATKRILREEGYKVTVIKKRKPRSKILIKKD